MSMRMYVLQFQYIFIDSIILSSLYFVNTRKSYNNFENFCTTLDNCKYRFETFELLVYEL